MKRPISHLLKSPAICIIMFAVLNLIFLRLFPKRAKDPPALLHKNTAAHPTEEWLKARICEIHAFCGQHLPTTAILVAHEDDVELLRQKLKCLRRFEPGAQFSWCDC